MLRQTIVLLSLVVVSGCGPSEEERRLTAQIEEHTQSKNLLYEQLAGHEKAISSLRVQSNELEQSLQTYNNEVEAYLMDHKAAAVCMAAADVALSNDNEYSQDVQDLGTGTAILCTLGGLANPDFIDEVLAVADRLVQADAHAKNLRSQLQSVQDRLNTETTTAAADRSRYDSLTTEIQNLRLRLEEDG